MKEKVKIRAIMSDFPRLEWVPRNAVIPTDRTEAISEENEADLPDREVWTSGTIAGQGGWR